ncbi:MAG: DUF4365 domain-containing protein [Cyanobacteria bacterium P01_A01_bin.84]
MADTSEDKSREIFIKLMSEPHSDSGAIFKPRYLEDKLPYVDYIVELVGAPGTVPYFFVQFKSTKLGYTKKDKRLRVKFPQENVRGLAAYSAPTYIVGIDEKEETGYLISVEGEELSAIASIPSLFPINMQNRGNLWNEVNDFWLKCNRVKKTSQFIEAEEN